MHSVDITIKEEICGLVLARRYLSLRNSLYINTNLAIVAIMRAHRHKSSPSFI